MTVPAGNYAVFVTLTANLSEGHTVAGVDPVQGICEITAGAPSSPGFSFVGTTASIEPPSIQGSPTLEWNISMVVPVSIEGTVTLAVPTTLYVSCAVLVANTAVFKISNVQFTAIKLGTLTEAP